MSDTASGLLDRFAELSLDDAHGKCAVHHIARHDPLQVILLPIKADDLKRSIAYVPDVVEDHVQLLRVEGHADSGFNSVVISESELRRSTALVRLEFSGVDGELCHVTNDVIILSQHKPFQKLDTFFIIGNDVGVGVGTTEDLPFSSDSVLGQVVVGKS